MMTRRQSAGSGYWVWNGPDTTAVAEGAKDARLIEKRHVERPAISARRVMS